MGLQPDGDSKLLSESVLAEDEEPDFTARQALRTTAFWTLTIMQVASSIAIVTLALHLVPKLTDMGMTLSGAGTVVLTYTIVALPAQFLSGYFADRLPTLGLPFRLALRNRIRWSQPIDHSYPRRIFREKGLRNDNGHFPVPYEYRDDWGPLVCRLYV